MSNFRRNLRRILYTESVDVSYVENCVTYIEKNSAKLSPNVEYIFKPNIERLYIDKLPTTRVKL